MISLIALFVSLGGVSYGVATIGSKQIKNNSIRGTDIRNGTVRGKDVGNGSITGADVKDDSLTGADVLESRLGTVPSAARAASAATATRAASAASADTASKLGGAPASAFEPRQRWALVDPSASNPIVKQSGGITVVNHAVNTQTALDFGTSQFGKPIQVTPVGDASSIYALVCDTGGNAVPPLSEQCIHNATRSVINVVEDPGGVAFWIVVGS